MYVCFYALYAKQQGSILSILPMTSSEHSRYNEFRFKLDKHKVGVIKLPTNGKLGTLLLGND